MILIAPLRFAAARLRTRCGILYKSGTKNVPAQDLLGCITVNPEIFGGKSIIRGMRISVELVLSLLARGESIDGLLHDYPDLEEEYVRACIAYAHAVIANDKIDAIRVGGA
jgi:uncharacterized protein (DUF433 family)